MSHVFDYQASLRRMGQDGNLFREMVGLLRDDGSRRMHDVTAGLTERDANRVRHAAHTLKGLTANFSAARAVEAAEKVERLATAEKWDELEPATANLEAALAELLVALKSF